MNMNVFINCPYDKDFAQLLRSLIFTVVTLGYVPRLALEYSDAGTSRMENITGLINEARISVHDLSRIQATTPFEYYRLNMPFELGLDYGYKHFVNSESGKQKKIMIMGAEKYKHEKAISDISGIDLKYHNNDVQQLIKIVTSWFIENEDIPNKWSPRKITNLFMDFNADFFEYLNDQGYKEEECPLKLQIKFIEHFHANLPK